MPGHFIEQFNEIVKYYGEKPAIYFGKEIYTYGDLNQLSNNIANEILSFNFPKETIIPLLLERTPRLIITMLGILKSGCAFLPISPSSPCSRIEYILEEINSVLIFCDTSNPFKLPSNTKRINPENVISKKSSTPLNLSYEDKDLAYVMYTSGSTGKPKGVLIEHQSMMNLFSSLVETLNLNDEDCFLALTDYTFDISLIELLMPFILGASVVLTEQGTVADGKKIKEYLNNFNISLIQATPLTWEILLKNNWCNDGSARILVGGEKFKTSLALKLNYEKGNVWNVYGPTETSMWSMIYHLTDRITTESVPLGKPIANTTLKLVYEPDAAQAELYIGGLGVARGYLNAYELTSTKFIFDKQENERFYKTGDLVTERENLICYVDRKDYQLKFGGIRIEAGEIETAIEQEAFVKKAVVKIHEHEDYYKTLAAYVELDEVTVFSHLVPEITKSVSYLIEEIYDETYSHAKDFENEVINTCGWQNSFTGSPFQPNELAESYINIKEWIKKSDLTSVLEIGCGTGSLVQEYLPKAGQVTLLEISDTAINYVNSILPKNLLNKVKFQLDSITNLNDISKYSCILVNSVIQYLPDVKTVIASIQKLITATKSGGTILIGDVRSLELLDSFLAIKHYCHNDNDIDSFPSHLFYKSRDTEIVLSPLFFYSLKTQFKRISWVDINLKHGDHKNELNYFRYDVVLHIEKPVKLVDFKPIDFSEITSFQNIEDILKREQISVEISNVPYNYLNTLCENFSILNNNFLNSILVTGNAFSNKDIALSQQILKGKLSGFETFIQYQINKAQRYLRVLIAPNSSTNEIIRPITINKENFESPYFYAKEPFNPWLQKLCFDRIKMNIKKRIMAWVNPSIYIWVEKWPQTINGKLDKNKLLLPTHSCVDSDKNSALSQLKQMWVDITGDNALITQEFWTHGISSLSMYYFLASINNTFHLSMTYHQFHQYNTIKKLAEYIENTLCSLQIGELELNG